MPPNPASRAETSDRLARRALFAFALTFIISRAAVFLIMSHSIPNLFLFLQGTHVHHLNYGIFLLAVVGGYTLFRRPDGRAAELAATAYGFALALTFDEPKRRAESSGKMKGQHGLAGGAEITGDADGGFGPVFCFGRTQGEREFFAVAGSEGNFGREIRSPLVGRFRLQAALDFGSAEVIGKNGNGFWSRRRQSVRGLFHDNVRLRKHGLQDHGSGFARQQLCRFGRRKEGGTRTVGQHHVKRRGAHFENLARSRAGAAQMIVTGPRRLGQFAGGFGFGPDDHHVGRVAIRFRAEKISLSGLVREINATEWFGAGQQTAHSGQSQVARARGEVGPEQAVLDCAFGIMRQHEIENSLRALMKGQRVGLGQAFALDPEFLVAQFFEFFIAGPIGMDAAFGDPEWFAR